MATLVEGTKQQKDGWMSSLELSRDEFDILVERQIFKAELDQQLRRCFRLDLVGLLFTNKDVFVSLPKIFGAADNSNTVAITRNVVDCLHRYFRRNSRRPRMSASELLSIHQDEGQIVNTFLAILNWTLDHGFQREPVERADDEINDVDWRATMDEGLPLHIAGSVFYSGIIGREKRTQLGPLARTQARCLHDLHAALSPASELWINSGSDLLEEAKEIIQEADEESALISAESIREFLASCNLDADRELATILLDWTEDRHRSAQTVGAFGSTAFHYVWEDICRAIMLGRDASATPSHGEIASQPRYELRGRPESVGDQRPDIMRTLDDHYQIYDAKWYHEDLPGTNDVVKQIVYEISLQPSLKASQNAFLLPTKGEKIETIGSAGMQFTDGTQDERFPRISLVTIPWPQAVEAYCGLLPAAAVRDEIASVTPSR